MDLKATQRLLASLYTDETLRQRFLSAPSAVAVEFGITGADARHLAGLSSSQLSGFSRSLTRKRLQELRRVLPATCRALGPRLEDLFARHAAEYHPTGLHRHAADAAAFAAFVARPPLAVPGAVADLASYESHALQFHLGRKFPLLAVFHSDPRRYAPAESDGARPPCLTLAVWFHLFGRPRNLVVTFPFPAVWRWRRARDAAMAQVSRT